jgi:DNA polymerase III epsilon subunit-like protein
VDQAEKLAAAWRAAYGPMPEDYLVVDVETSGLSTEYDVVVQLGWLRAVGGREVERGAIVLDWSQVLDGHDLRQLERRLGETAAKMSAAGKGRGWTLDRLRAEGLHPARAVDKLAGFLGRRPVLVGHNPWRFDLPLLDKLAARLRGLPLGVPPNQCIDTAAMVKAAQSGCTPRPGETYRDYAARANAAGGNKYLSSLDRFCVGRFRLASRHGVDVAKTHDAAYDCWVCHLVYEDLRQLVLTGRLPAEERVLT